MTIFCDLNLKTVNIIAQALLYSSVDILGQQILEEKLKVDTALFDLFSLRTFTMADLSEFFTVLLCDYIPNVAQGLSQRIGRVFFHYLRRTHQKEILNNSLEFRLLPFHQRVENSLEQFFQWLKKEMTFNFSIIRQKEGWKIQLETLIVKQKHALVLNFFKGILLEIFEWMDCHYRYMIDVSEMIKDDHQLICFDITYLPLD